MQIPLGVIAPFAALAISALAAVVFSALYPQLQRPLGIVAPYATFAVGVFIADQLSLYPNMPRLHVYLKPLPVGMFAVSFLLLNGLVVVPAADASSGFREDHYGHLQSTPHFLMFCATTMFAGTYAPGVFAAYRTTLGGPSTSGNAREANQAG